MMAAGELGQKSEKECDLYFEIKSRVCGLCPHPSSTICMNFQCMASFFSIVEEQMRMEKRHEKDRT